MSESSETPTLSPSQVTTLFEKMMEQMERQDLRMDQSQTHLNQVQSEVADAARKQTKSMANLALAITNMGGTIPSTSTAPMSNVARAKMKFSTPSPFSGDKKKFEHFQEHCKNYLTITDPTTTEDENFFWTITYLDGAAAEFIKPFMAINWRYRSLVSWLHNWTNFWSELEKRFGNPNLIEE